MKQIIVRQAYANFQEMYERAVKVARIINETEIGNRERSQAKRRLGPRGPNFQRNTNFKRVKPGMRQNKRKHPAQWQ